MRPPEHPGRGCSACGLSLTTCVLLGGCCAECTESATTTHNFIPTNERNTNAQPSPSQ